VTRAGERFSRAVAWLLAGAMLAAVPAGAESERFVFSIAGHFMVPPTDSPAAGSGDLLLDLPTTTFSGFIDFGSLRGTLTSLRICGPARNGEIGPVLYDLGRTRHVLLSGLTHDQLRDLRQERWYLLVCTNVYPQGEEGGQIVHAITSLEARTWSGIKALFR
jgi:CHRD domain-containing protein